MLCITYKHTCNSLHTSNSAAEFLGDRTEVLMLEAYGLLISDRLSSEHKTEFRCFK